MLAVFDVRDCVLRHIHHMEHQQELIRETMARRRLRQGKAIMIMDLTELNMAPSTTGMGILRSVLEIDQVRVACGTRGGAHSTARLRTAAGLC